MKVISDQSVKSHGALTCTQVWLFSSDNLEVLRIFVIGSLLMSSRFDSLSMGSNLRNGILDLKIFFFK